MKYKNIEIAKLAIAQVIEDIRNINKQITAYYEQKEVIDEFEKRFASEEGEGKKSEVKDKDAQWLKRAMVAKSKKKYKIKKIKQWIEELLEEER